MLATDFDRTLVGKDSVIRPRTRAAVARAHEAGLRTIVVTGRMFRSVRPYLLDAGMTDPVVCYQGAVVADPVSGAYLRHVPIDLEDAREALAALEGWPVNLYVDDLLYVAETTPEARSYADFQHLELHEVGNLLAWIEKPPTKIVVVGEPDRLDELEVETKALFGTRLYISKSLPYFLEFANPAVTKAAGLEFLGGRLGFGAADTVAFGDGENDVELIEWAGFGVAVANAHERVLAVADFVCPSADEEGVAQAIEALLDSRG